MKGGETVPGAKYPYDEYIYYFCAKEFGWTPLETDAQPARIVDWVCQIAGVLKEGNDANV